MIILHETFFGWDLFVRVPNSEIEILSEMRRENIRKHISAMVPGNSRSAYLSKATIDRVERLSVPKWLPKPRSNLAS